MTDSPSPRAAAGAAPNAGQSPLRVLIADDDHDTVLTLMAILRHEGYETRGVYRGDEVLRVAREFQPDAVLLDITMPGMSGYDAARELREGYGEKLVLIAITAWWKQPSDKLLARMVGFNYHFGKPYEAQAIIEVLSAIKPNPGENPPRPERRGRLLGS